MTSANIVVGVSAFLDSDCNVSSELGMPRSLES